MSNTYYGAGAPVGAHQSGSPVQRPKTLAVAILTAASAIVFAAVAAVMILAGGPEALSPVVAEIAGTTLGADLTAGAFMDVMLEEAYAIYSGRAYMYLFFATTGLVVLLLAAKAKTWARALLTLIMLIGLGLGALNALDVGTSTHIALSTLVAIASLVAAVAFWLPAVNRFAKASRKV